MGKGITYYKLNSDYKGDITKNCSLKPSEVDGNFYTLEGRDVKSVRVEDDCIVLTLYNGEEITSSASLYEGVTKDISFEYDTATGTLYITRNGETQEISGFTPPIAHQVSVANNATIIGDGTGIKPIGISPLYTTGQYRPVKRIIKLDKGGCLPAKDDLRQGDRYVTSEYVSRYGYLYTLSGVKSIMNDLIANASQWRVPTKEDWDNMLNAVEPNECDRNHNSVVAGRYYGRYAGKMLKSCFDWLAECSEEPIVEKYCEDDEEACIETVACECTDTSLPPTQKLYNGIDKYGFCALPAGYADDGDNCGYYQERAWFWTGTNKQTTNAYTKRFEYNKSSVYQDVMSSAYHLSVRLVKDYDGSNYQENEEILGNTYSTVLLPKKDGYAVWTSANFANTNKRYSPMLPNEGQNLPQEVVYFIREWDGCEWHKKELKEGDSIVVMDAPKSKTAYEYRFIGGELISVGELVYNDVLDTITPILQKVSDDLSAEIDRAVEAETVLQTAISDETERATNREDEIETALNAEIEYVAEAITTINENAEALATKVNEIESTFTTFVEETNTSLEELESELSEETSSRETADATLQSSVNALATTVENYYSELTDSIAAEAKEREDADEALEVLIETETNERKSGDENLLALIHSQDNSSYNATSGALTIASNGGENDITLQLSFDLGTDMGDTDYRLQLRRYEEIFSDRETALKYITTKYQYGADILVGEPTVFLYGDEDAPSLILTIGTSEDSIEIIDIDAIEERLTSLENVDTSTLEDVSYALERVEEIITAAGLTLDENKKSDLVTYEPDSSDGIIGNATSLAEAVSLLSAYAQTISAASVISFNDTSSIIHTVTSAEDGSKTITSDVAISTYGNDDSQVANDNILGMKSDGLYAAVDLSYDEDSNTLTFVTSGISDGSFVDDAKSKTFSLGEHTEYTSDNEDHDVAVTIDNDEYTISAEVKLSEDSANLLTVVDGKLMAEAKAENIQYNSSTVYTVLSSVESTIEELTSSVSTLETTVEEMKDFEWLEGDTTDTLEITPERESTGVYKITGDVRLGSNNTIITANGGLEVNMTASSDLTNNQLIITLGNTTYTLDYPAIDVIDNAYYDSTNRTLVFEFNNGSSVSVPVEALIDTYVFDNPTTSPVVFSTTTDSSTGVTTVTATLKLSSTDNMIELDSEGYLRVPLSTVTEAVEAEAARAVAAEEAIASDLSDEIDRAKTTEGELAHSIDILAASLEAETTRAENAESTLNTLVETYKDSIDEAYSTLQSSVETNAASISSLETSVSENANSISTLATSVETLNGNEETVGSVAYLIKAETTAREVADASIVAASEAGDAALQAEIDTLSSSVETNAASISSLDERLTTAESEIDELQTEVTRQNLMVEETNTVKLSKDKEDDGTTLSADVKLNEDVTGNILQYNGNGLYATVELSYDESTNTLTFTTGANGSVDIPLASGTLLQSAEYDSESNSITLVFVTGDATETITIPATDLVQYIEVVNTTDNPIILSKSESDGTVYLSASVNISTAETNGLLNDNGTLYVSNFATELYGLWDDETVSLQTIITHLKSYTDQVDGIVSDAEELTTTVTTLENTVANIEEDVEELQEDVSTNTTNITTNAANIATLEGTVSAMSATITEISNSVATVNERLSNVEEELEESIEELSESVTSNTEAIADLQTSLAEVNGSLTTLTTQMITLSTTVNNAVAEIEDLKEEITESVSEINTRVVSIENDIEEINTTLGYGVVVSGEYDEDGNTIYLYDKNGNVLSALDMSAICDYGEY